MGIGKNINELPAVTGTVSGDLIELWHVTDEKNYKISAQILGLFTDTGTVVKLITARAIDLQSAGLRDTNVTTAVNLGDGSNTSFATTNKTIIGAVNEVRGMAITATVWDRNIGTLTLTPHTANDNVDIGSGTFLTNGGYKDTNVTTAILLGDSSNTSFNTTNKTIVGSVNEVRGLAGVTGIQETLTISSDGQTNFTLAHTALSTKIIVLSLNGQVRTLTTDFTVSGTTVTWLNPGSLTLLTTDELIIRYNYAS